MDPMVDQVDPMVDPMVDQVDPMGTHVVPTTLLPTTQVLWFEQQTVKSRAKRSGSVVPTDPWFPKQWYMVRLCRPPT